MTISNCELIDLANQYGIKINVIMNNEIKEYPLVNCCHIINLENDNETGSHWVCCIMKNGQKLYCDSFGCVPSLEVEKYLHKSKSKYMFNNRIIQDLHSVECGLFSLALIIYVDKFYNKTNDLFECANEFYELFDHNNLKNNDKIIKKMFKNHFK